MEGNGIEGTQTRMTTVLTGLSKYKNSWEYHMEWTESGIGASRPIGHG